MAEGDLRGSSTRFSLSFSGSGFLVLYQVGVVQSLLELAPELLKSACKVYGSSAGSLIAAAVVCGVSLVSMGKQEVRKTILGPLSPKCSLLANIKTVLQQMLPEDSYQLASGRLHISLTRVVDGQNVMASEFSSKEELIQALLCSCFLPIYCGFIPPSYRGVRYVDGGFTGLQPVSSLEEAVITVSPFTGELDICPRDCPAIFLCFQIFNGSIQISIENLCRISYALFPPSAMVSPPGLLPSFILVKTNQCWTCLPNLQRTSALVVGNQLVLAAFPNGPSQPSTVKQPWRDPASAWMEGSLVTSNVSPCRTLPFSCTGTVSVTPRPEGQPRSMPLALTTSMAISASPACVGRTTLHNPTGRAPAYAKGYHSA
uniref:Patatin like phospholipase domain containing 1 n=1 Tax=Aquila chrysaetos chrysaetos TaxID=223781 RepID=A0A663FE00_AQUCH